MKNLKEIEDDLYYSKTLQELFEVYIFLVKIYKSDKECFVFWKKQLSDELNRYMDEQRRLDDLVFFCNNGYYR